MIVEKNFLHHTLMELLNVVNVNKRICVKIDTNSCVYHKLTTIMVNKG